LSLYLDTSLLVAALVRESGTPRVQDWLAKQEQGALAISEWVRTEFSSALSIKLRSGQIDVKHRAAALAKFMEMSAESLTTLLISPLHFRAAARLADQHGLGLRGGVRCIWPFAPITGATLCTLDRQLAEAGVALGAKVQLV
jgi:predicted nucleic acid-binding protein